MSKKTHKITNKLEGVISISSKGTGYVKIEKKDEDIEIDSRHLNTALHGDTVAVVIHPKMHDRLTGEVSKIISRAKNGFAGVLEEENGIFFLKPDDTRIYTDILIPEKMLSGAKAGDKVFAKIFSWEDSKKAPEGKVEKV